MSVKEALVVEAHTQETRHRLDTDNLYLVFAGVLWWNATSKLYPTKYAYGFVQIYLWRFYSS